MLATKLKFHLSLFFTEKDWDMMFDNVLIETKGFLDNKNVILTKQNNVHFSRGLNHDFGQKVEISLLFRKWT